ncbi:hypothetical protein M406DRAFT_220509, partial [Cryphonectria parasitica EP155]
IKPREIILLAEVQGGGGYVILTLSEEAEPGQEEPFRISCFLAPTLPQDLIRQHVVTDLPEFLKVAASSASLDVIVSVRSGTGLAPKFYDAVLRPLLGILGLQEKKSEDVSAAGEPSYRVTVTQDANTVKDFPREKWGPDAASKSTVLLLSGDGGVVDLLNSGVALPSPGSSHLLPTVVLLPLGTGNALFHSLHKPHYTTTTTTSPGDLLPPPPPPPPDTPAYRQHGDKRFGMVAQELLRDLHGYEVEVVTAPSGRLVVAGGKGGGGGGGGAGGAGGAGGFNYVLATMVSNLEKTFTISPDSRPLDGKLRLVHFGGKSGEETMAIMMAAYGGGKHVGMAGVGYQQEDEVRLTSLERDARWRKVCVDGTIVELAEGGTMDVKTDQEPRLNIVFLDATT